MAVSGSPAIELTIRVLASSIVLSGESIDLGEVSSKDMKSGQVRAGRVGLRRVVGTMQIKSVSISLPFLNAAADTVVAGANYVIRVSITQGAVVQPGSYNALVLVETDDPNRPRIEIPCKLRVTP